MTFEEPRESLKLLLIAYADATRRYEERLDAARAINDRFPLHANARLLGRILSAGALDDRATHLVVLLLGAIETEDAVEELGDFVENQAIDPFRRAPAAMLLMRLSPRMALEAVVVGLPHLQPWAERAARNGLVRIHPQVSVSEQEAELRELLEHGLLDRLK